MFEFLLQNLLSEFYDYLNFFGMISPIYIDSLLRIPQFSLAISPVSYDC